MTKKKNKKKKEKKAKRMSVSRKGVVEKEGQGRGFRAIAYAAFPFILSFISIQFL